VRRDDIYLSDILESIRRIELYAQDGKEAFTKSTMIQDGIIRNLEIIGEAANQLGTSFQETYPHVDWRGIISLRNLLIHQYHRVDLNLVWQVVMRDIPELKEKISEITHQFQ
jgi:uncharacterized protein with HEPN domain